MKISERNTALNFLYEDMTPYHFRLSEDIEHSELGYKQKFGLSIVREWPKMKPLFNKKVRYISQPFFNAYEKAVDKLGKVLDNEPVEESGTFVSTRDGGGTNTIFYSIRSEGKDKDFRLWGIILFFGKDPHKEKPSLDVFVQRIPGGTKEYLAENCIRTGTTGISVFADIFTLLLFIKYCEIETRVIEGKSKAHHVGQKYVNETKQRVEVLDSTWFTTIIKSEGFTVGAETGGFFRMQPYGPGFSQKKLIWVMPFEKEGYTRKAKILTQA